MTQNWKPQPKQAQALKSPAFELLYGGAAGGGKSDFLLADYLYGVNEWGPAWNGIIFRRSFPELEGLIRRAKEIYIPAGASWREGDKLFRFPTGAEIRFRHLDNDNDVTIYQGQQYTWAGFDELGNYRSDFAWGYIRSRTRSAAGAPCFIRATANPGGVGHAWIKARFIDGLEPEKIYRDPETGLTKTFIPAKLQDNHILMANDPDYMNRLKSLPTHLRRSLLDGDWDVFAGQVFDEWRRDRHVVKPFSLPPGQWKRFYSLDWGFAKPFSLGKWAINGEGRMVRYGEWYGRSTTEYNTGIRLGADAAASQAWKMALLEGVTECVADPAIWGKTDDGPSVGEKWEKAGFRMIPGIHDRLNGMSMVHDRLMTDGEDDKPMMLIFDHCVDFIRTIPTLVPDPLHPEDVDTHLEDHIYDETRYAVMSEFAHHPADALRRQNGDWNLRRRGRNWNPLA
jgi:hypothetical protein